MRSGEYVNEVTTMTGQPVLWPKKRDVFGVGLSPTTYDEAVDVIARTAANRQRAIVSCHAVHALINFSGDSALREQVNTCERFTPDGHPVRWSLNLLHRSRLQDRVYGPELMYRLCRRAANDRLPIYLYGGTDSVLGKLKTNLQ